MPEHLRHTLAHAQQRHMSRLGHGWQSNHSNPQPPRAPACPGLFEELLFRGVIQQWLGANLGPLPGLGLTSVLFGLAHSPVPGASSFTEACYGANFGLLYMVSSEAQGDEVQVGPIHPQQNTALTALYGTLQPGLQEG